MLTSLLSYYLVRRARRSGYQLREIFDALGQRACLGHVAEKPLGPLAVEYAV